ncbi:hypothetical protein CoNPh11_CDS0058 [Staphylococcus phage S-CoN_Ph11]|nr:hypothetical protein CoNPh11_CDS0058 [Staphylococcus phage S-CoN_Ph11]
MNEYIKKTEESITAYSIRLYKNRATYGLTFQEIGDLLNEVSGENHSEAKWRRPIQNYLQISRILRTREPSRINFRTIRRNPIREIRA